MNRVSVLPIAVYFSGAFGLTYVFNQLPELILLSIDVKEILCGWGPLLSGLICYQLFKVPNHYHITLNGVRPYLALGIVLLALSLPLVTIRSGSKVTLLTTIISQFLYSFGEEVGWRHYLQNATHGLNKWLQYLLIGCLWFAWHYSFTPDPVRAMAGQVIPPIVGIPLFILILSLVSFVWGDLVIKTRSILLPTVWHYLPKVGNGLSVGIIFTLLIILQTGWRWLNKQIASPSV